jgi:hypothetical protein
VLAALYVTMKKPRLLRSAGLVSRNSENA